MDGKYSGPNGVAASHFRRPIPQRNPRPGYIEAPRRGAGVNVNEYEDVYIGVDVADGKDKTVTCVVNRDGRIL